MHGNPGGSDARFSTGGNGVTEDRGAAESTDPPPAEHPEAVDDLPAESSRRMLVVGAIWAVALLALIVLGSAYAVTRYSQRTVASAPPAVAAPATTTSPASSYGSSYGSSSGSYGGSSYASPFTTSYALPTRNPYPLAAAKVGDCLDGPVMSGQIVPCSGVLAYQAWYKVTARVPDSEDCADIPGSRVGGSSFYTYFEADSTSYLCVKNLKTG